MNTQPIEIELPQQLTSAEVEELYKTVTAHKESNELCQLHGHLVEHVDFLGVQFLLACQKILNTDGKAVVSNASDALLQSIVDIGALEFMQLGDSANEKAIEQQ